MTRIKFSRLLTREIKLLLLSRLTKSFLLNKIYKFFTCSKQAIEFNKKYAKFFYYINISNLKINLYRNLHYSKKHVL